MSLESASIFDDINAGYWDEGLDAIIEIAVSRRNYLRKAQGAENMINFAPGTTVRVTNIKPKYLHGITGVVSTKSASRNGDLVVEIDQRCWHRLGRYPRSLPVPASCLEKV
jgi:hypothetical protein